MSGSCRQSIPDCNPHTTTGFVDCQHPPIQTSCCRESRQRSGAYGLLEILLCVLLKALHALLVAISNCTTASRCTTKHKATSSSYNDYDLQVFDDPATGVYFESPDGTIPERDRKGELAFRPVSFTPWPVETGTPGERLRIDVGPASGTSPRTFIFDR